MGVSYERGTPVGAGRLARALPLRTCVRVQDSGFASKAHRLCASLNSRLESSKEEEVEGMGLSPALALQGNLAHKK